MALVTGAAPSLAATAHDFNGDAKADILWRHTSGALYIWQLSGTSVVGTGSPGGAGFDWILAGVGDFNGDGKADILWRHTSGALFIWLLDGTSVISKGSPGGAGLDWTVAGVGDFSGDGKADILWRHTSGALFIWLLDGTSVISKGSPGAGGLDWTVAGVGDFNGDGKADILWRHSSGGLFIWLLDGTSIVGTGSPGGAELDWTVVGVGDFNGGGKADILWRHGSGALFIWLLDGTDVIGSGSPGDAGVDWTVVGVGDFDGDGRADILWRSTSGSLYEWLLNGTSTIGKGSPGGAGAEWQILAFTSALKITKLLGLNLSPYIDDQDPNLGAIVSEAQMVERLTRVVQYTEWVRFFGSTLGLERGPRLARAMGLKVACGAWIGESAPANDQEVANLIANALAGYCDLAIVGSEVLFRGDQTPAGLLAYLARVKQDAPAVPVTTADVYGQLLAHPEIVAAVDVVMPNYYPYWEEVELRYAVASIHANHQKVIAAAGGKPIVVSETGWPSCGNPVGAAVPSPENARSFAINFRSWSATYAIPYFFFEAYNEAWKAIDEGPQGACWGVWTAGGALKPWMEDFLSGATVPDNWSGHEPPGGPGAPAIDLSLVPPYGSFLDLKGQIWHVPPADYAVAVYIRVGSGWWTKPFFTQPSSPIWPDGTWTCDITTGGQDELANAIVAYLIPKSYTPPPSSGQPTLPEELDGHAVAKVSVTRTP